MAKIYYHQLLRFFKMLKLGQNNNKMHKLGQNNNKRHPNN